MTQRGGAWAALAVGDSCIFQVQGDEVISALPIDRATDFNNYPVLLCSLEARNERTWRNLEIREGRWKPGDELLLMTDALAQWFLQELEGGENPLAELREVMDGSLGRQGVFAQWVEALRSDKSIRNDDTTLGWASVTKS